LDAQVPGPARDCPGIFTARGARAGERTSGRHQHSAR
jgi:hypothetical protein